MKVLVLLFTIISFSSAKNLISFNEIETLFIKLMQNELTREESALLQDVFEIIRRPEPISDAPLHRSLPFRRNIECLVCRSVASAFITSILNGNPDEEVTKSLTVLCTGLGLFTYSVCHGAVALNVPILSYIIRNTPEASARTFCGLVLQTNDDPLACPFDDPRFDWVVELPEEVVHLNPIPVPVVADENPLKVAIITDAHIDPLYEAFGVADCNEPTCCRKGQTPAKHFPYSSTDETVLEERFVNVNGVKMLDTSRGNKVRKSHNAIDNMRARIFRKSEPAGYWGDYRNCDSPIWAFDDAIETIKENHGDIDLLYYVGDTIDHGIWETTYESVNKMHQYLINQIRQTFGDKVRVVPVIGNHESQPTNQFAPASVTGPKLNTTWLYNSLADKWKYYLTEEAETTLRASGDFSLLVRPGLRVISLNNNVAYRYNWWLMYDPTDAKKHLDWLVQELFRAEQMGEAVHILAHIPPGVEDLTHTWTREYNRIVNRFSRTIVAEFNAHTHTDEFRIFYDPSGRPINVAWGGGGIVTYSFYNLNYKIVEFHHLSFEPISMQNYIYNLTEANLTPHLRPRWFLLYDMKSNFGLGNLSPDTMNGLLYAMVTDERELLEVYAHFNSKYSDIIISKCGTTCKLDLICTTVTTVLWDRRKCEELKKLYISK